MTRYALTAIGIELETGNNLDVDLPVGARVVDGFVLYEPTTALVTTGGQRARTKPVPTLLLLFDPDEKRTERRHFVAIAVGEGRATDHTLVHVATFVLGPDRVVAIFEVVVVMGKEFLVTQSPVRCWRDDAAVMHHVFLRGDGLSCTCGIVGRSEFRPELDEEMT